ncbi:MAG: hypothetical protein ACE5IQ_01030 [Candidatus Methylomirabilales bacterium]
MAAISSAIEILVAADNPSDACTIRELLAHAGYEVEEWRDTPEE